MRIQSALGSDIAMAFDECVGNPCPPDYAEAACGRTLRWLERCVRSHEKLKEADEAVNPGQMLFGINQGCTYPDLRIRHMRQIADFELPGYAIGGLAVGESARNV
jgi:queuine tRNA-ribosyltransferase